MYACNLYVRKLYGIHNLHFIINGSTVQNILRFVWLRCSFTRQGHTEYKGQMWLRPVFTLSRGRGWGSPLRRYCIITAVVDSAALLVMPTGSASWSLSSLSNIWIPISLDCSTPLVSVIYGHVGTFFGKIPSEWRKWCYKHFDHRSQNKFGRCFILRITSYVHTRRKV